MKKQPKKPAHSQTRFPIVGIGASAGGLEAFTELLNHLPTDTGLGFVLVQHLDPQHESSLTQILKRATSLPVREIANNLRVEPDHIYVIPPNRRLAIAQGVLKLLPRKPGHAPTHSIDAFLESLAQDQRECAIGVILSGTASDGTVGLEAVKAEGGITFAQDDSARYDSMPRSAVAAGCVDAVLSPAEIAGELARIAKHPYVAEKPSPAHEEIQQPLRGDGYKKILSLLRQHSGVDFSLYKPTTIRRRIHRRMLLAKKDGLEQYANSLRRDPKELESLYSDCLISVTGFFRNPDVFELLKRKVFPALLKSRDDDPVRIWVLGCSTGQEAYSLAMAFQEAAEKSPRPRKLQIFATDLNDALLDKARRGLYARNLVEDVSPERLQQFFVEEENGYRVIKSLREMIVFARQNVTNDPPFSRMDLISCRNLLIYLEPGSQKAVMPMFHYALKPKGWLLLGASESVGGFGHLFELIDRKHKVYSKKSVPTPASALPLKQERREKVPTKPPLKAGATDLPVEWRGGLTAQREADRVTMNQYAPPGVLINAEMQILQFRGSTAAYLEPPTGNATFHVLKMAREGLVLPLRAAINKAKKENKTVRRDHVPVRQNGRTRSVNLEVIPLKNLRERCFLISFHEAGKRPAPPVAPVTGKKESAGRIRQLETELSETRDYMQSIQEQQEAANEELQASNEEVQSANEELQSVNEELETSKEELESANEELTTLNDEVANRNAKLVRNERIVTAARDFAEAVVRTVPAPLVTLETNLRVYKANDAFYKTFLITPAETERRLIYEVGNGQWDIPALRELLEHILPDRTVFNDFEVTHDFSKIGLRTFLLNARRLDAFDGQPSRILLGFQDVTERRLLEGELEGWRGKLEQRVARQRTQLTAEAEERKRLETEVTRAVEAEQKRLGQLLHDGLAQELTGLSYQLQALEMGLGNDAPAFATKAKRFRQMLDKTRDQARNLAKGFYPVELEKHGLLAALRELAEHNTERFGIPVVIEGDDKVTMRLKDGRAIQLFRIAQEAVHNAAKHSRADKIVVRLTAKNGDWRLVIKDDGVGLKKDPQTTAGMGLRIMKYRAHMIGGTLELRNDDGGGVIVSCSAPAKRK